MEDLVCRHKRVGYHQINCLARLVKIDLSEEFEPSLKDQVDVVVELAIVGYLLLHNPCVVEDAGNLNLALVDLSVDRITIQVV